MSVVVITCLLGVLNIDKVSMAARYACIMRNILPGASMIESTVRKRDQGGHISTAFSSIHTRHVVIGGERI